MHTLFAAYTLVLSPRHTAPDFQLPPSTKLQKDSVLALIKGSTVFINYIGKY